MRVKAASLIAVLSLMMVLAPGATAGGWATAVVVDDLEPITVGEPFTVRYVVRAHGIIGHEIEGMKTSLQFSHQQTEQVVKAAGTATTDPRISEATIILPSAGAWKWTVIIHNYLLDQAVESPMPSLAVTEAGQFSVSDATKTFGMTTIVTITDAGFSPATVEIAAGDTITWVNKGQMVHQVSSDALTFETSPMIQPGEAFFQTMVEPGRFGYLCPPHPAMTGSVVVT